MLLNLVAWVSAVISATTANREHYCHSYLSLCTAIRLQATVYRPFVSFSLLVSITEVDNVRGRIWWCKWTFHFVYLDVLKVLFLTYPISMIRITKRRMKDRQEIHVSMPNMKGMEVTAPISMPNTTCQRLSRNSSFTSEKWLMLESCTKFKIFMRTREYIVAHLTWARLTYGWFQVS